MFPYGTQLLSRNPRLALFDEAPIYFERAKDAHFWDVDGNEFIDCGMGLQPATFISNVSSTNAVKGYDILEARPPVAAAPTPAAATAATTVSETSVI